MKKYTLFNEWLKRCIYGSSLEDALIREGSLQRPKEHLGSGRYEDGENMRIAKVLSVKRSTGTRGSQEYQTALCEEPEPFTNSAAKRPGRIFEVDAVESEV